MSSPSSMEFTEDQLKKLLVSGLAGPIQEAVTQELAKLSQEVIKAQIKTHVEAVIKRFSAAQISTKHDPLGKQVIIQIEFIEK